jgi:hypothetical protein
MSTPSFHSTQPSSGDRRYPPQNPADFARFVALAVNRYKPGGTFWRSHPELRPDPIRAWQIWNEPSLVTFWEPKPNPVAYTRLLKAAYRAIKRADRNAEVVTAGLPWYAIGKFAKDYYKAMFRAGAGRYFDALAFHAYAPNAADAIARVQHVRQLLDSFGLRQKAIWLTEWGWAASGPRFPYVAYGQQVPYTQRFLRWVMRNRSLDRIERIFYFCWRDASPAPPSQDWWGRHMGMYRYDLTPKWVAGVVARFASRLDR